FAQAVIKPPQAAAHCFALGAAPAGTFEPSTTTTEKASKITRSIWYLLCNRGRADRLEREHGLAPTGKSRQHVDRRIPPGCHRPAGPAELRPAPAVRAQIPREPLKEGQRAGRCSGQTGGRGEGHIAPLKPLSAPPEGASNRNQDVTGGTACARPSGSRRHGDDAGTPR